MGRFRYTGYENLDTRTVEPIKLSITGGHPHAHPLVVFSSLNWAERGIRSDSGSGAGAVGLRDVKMDVLVRAVNVDVDNIR